MKTKRILAFVIALCMILSSTAFAAVPNGTVVIGDTAYDLSAMAKSELEGTINNKFVDNNNNLLFKEFNGNWVNALNIEVTNPTLAPSITLHKGDGTQEVINTDVDVEELEVVNVSAINESTIEVTFSEAVDAAVEANFSLTKGTLKSVSLNAAKTVATLSVEGLTFGDTLDVTVKDVKAGTAELVTVTKEVKIPAFGEIYKVVVEPGKAAIKADGLSKTMVTARILNKVTNEYVKEQGQVSFTTTKGDFAQPKVSFDQNGVAALQLTSEVSTNDVTAYITATITSVPGATQYEGLVGQIQVKFVVDEASGELDLVTMINASSSQADRINVEFNAPVTVEQIIDQYKATATKTKFEVAQADNFGFRVDEPQFVVSTAPITNIEQVNAKTIRLILDTDNKFDEGIKGTTELRYNYLTKQGSNYDAQATADNVPFNGAFLRDNMTHNVSIPSTGSKVLENQDGADFVLTDISQPWIKGVNAVNQMEIEVIFSEAMAEDIAELTEAGLYKNFRIDGKRLMPIAGAKSNATERLTATNNNYLLVKDLDVNEYWEKGKVVDRRNVVTIEIDSWNKLAPGEYSVQASNVGDWAAMTHEANMLVTQTFDFTVKEDTDVPTVTLTEHSPEQWLLTFDKPVKINDTKKLEDAIKIFTREEYTKTSPTALKMTNAIAPAKHYQVTAVNKDGELVSGNKNGYSPTTNVADVERLLIEFKQDWTVEYDTETTNINYFHSTKNPYVVVVEHWEDYLTDNSMAKTVLMADTPLDKDSPEIENATDVFDLDGKSIRGATSTATGQFVFVEMNEPVQLRNAGDTVVTTPLTESQQQAAGAGIPIPTFEFVKGDKVIPGSIVAGSIPQDDYDFVVEPKDTLDAGTWTLIIRSISDDVGNTSATVSRDFVIKAGEQVDTDTRISWIGFDDEAPAGEYDYIFVKFTKEMKSTGADGVARTTNYSLNNNPLPLGSEIIKGIKDWEGNATYGNVTNDWDGVTIKMPKDAWDGTTIAGGIDYTLVFGVASNFKATDGEDLSSPYTVQLNHVQANTGADADFDFEAQYLNKAAGVTNLVGGKAVVGAIATDTNTNGEIETVSLYDIAGNKVAGAAGHEILVNGVKFKVSGSDYVTTKPFKTTDASGLNITSTTGAVIIGNGNVIDDAAPVITKAELNSDKTKLTVTMSERVSQVNTGLFVPVTQTDKSTGDFTFSLTGAADVKLATDGHVSGSANTIVFDVTDGNLIKGSDTIKVNANVFDMNTNTIPGTGNPADTATIELAGGLSGAAATNAETTPGVDAVAGEYTVTFTGVFAVADTVTIDLEVLTLTATSTDNVTAAAEVKTLAEANTTLNDHYTITDDGAGVLTFVEKAGEESGSALTVTSTATGSVTLGTTTASTAGVAEINTITVGTAPTADGTLEVTFNDGTINKTIDVPVESTDLVNDVATKIKNALSGDSDIIAAYTVVDSTNTVVITSNVKADITVTITITDK